MAVSMKSSKTAPGGERAKGTFARRGAAKAAGAKHKMFGLFEALSGAMKAGRK